LWPLQALIDSPGKSNTLPRRQQLKIQLNAIEQEIIAKRYNSTSEVEQAVADISRLMTSLSYVIAPTSGIDVISASDSALMSSPGSKASSSSLDSGSDEFEAADDGRLVDSRSSFRVAELLPIVRRFIMICQQLTAAAIDSDHADEFDRLMTDSVHAFIAILAVSRRASYGQRERSLLNEALREVAQSYRDMLSAAEPAVGLATDHPAVIAASKKSASFAERLSSLLFTVKNLKPGKIAFF